jgi:hypothetical protein
MVITEEKLIRLAEIGEQKTKEMWEEWLAELRKDVVPGGFDTVGSDSNNAAADQLAADRSRGYDAPWSFEKINPITGGWVETSRVESGETYLWPDGNVVRYKPFVTYSGTGDLTGALLALGYRPTGEVVGFIVGAGGGSKRALTVFFPTDDHATTDEVISMIKGGGDRGRAGFKANDPLPEAYQGFRAEMLASRVSGKWNVQAVVAKADDHTTMLNHTALQAKLRGLI